MCENSTRTIDNDPGSMTETNRVFSDHRIHALLERSIDAAKKLENIYEDEDGLRKEEVSRIGGPNEFKEFYDRLRSAITLFIASRLNL